MKSIIIKKILLPIVEAHYFKTSSVLFSTSVIYKEEKVKVGKYNINYLRVGTGSHKVLCMPGALGSIWKSFKPQIEGFDTEKFNLVAWDPPGYGRSRPPEKEYPTNFCEKDADAAFEFMQAIKVPKFSLMGWSFGAISSIILAAKYPEAVHKLVIWGARSFILQHELESYTSIRDVSKWSEEMRKPMIEYYGKENVSKLWAEFVDAMVAFHSATGGDICSDLLKDIKCPTFILYGEKDPLINKTHVFYLNRNIQGSRVYIYREGKHNIHLRYATDFNKRVQEFLLQR